MNIGIAIALIVVVVTILVFSNLTFLIQLFKDIGGEYFCKDCKHSEFDGQSTYRCKNNPFKTSESEYKVTGVRYRGDLPPCVYIRETHGNDCGHEPKDEQLKG